MTLVLVCPNRHTRELVNVTTKQEHAYIAACVKARLPRCYVCRRPIVKCEETKPS